MHRDIRILPSIRIATISALFFGEIDMQYAINADFEFWGELPMLIFPGPK